MNTLPLVPSWRFPFPVKGTLAEIAERTRVPLATVQAQMSGRAKPSLTLALLIAHHYSIGLGELVTLVANDDSLRQVRPQDRGVAGNGRHVRREPWDPDFTDTRYPGMTPDTHLDGKWVKTYSPTSPNRPDYAQLGVPIPGSIEFSWWQYRMQSARGNVIAAAGARVNAELFYLGHDEENQIEEMAYTKLYHRRSAEIEDALNGGYQPDPLSRVDAREAFEKLARKIAKKGVAHEQRS